MNVMRRRIARHTLVLALSLGSTASCGGSPSPSDGGSDGFVPNDSGLDPAAIRAALPGTLARDVILPTIRTFETDAIALETAAAAYAADPSNTALGDALRSAFTAAFATWQRAEVMQLGPAGLSTAAIGGQDIRDEVYAWPQAQTNLCNIDRDLFSQTNYTSEVALAGRPVTVRGFEALEYLLFNEGLGTACQLQPDPDNWATLDAATITARRAAYANTVAALLRDQATRLRNEWEPTGENFLANFDTPGQNGSVYSSVNEALNNITNAMFYVYETTRESKVGWPSGASEYALCVTPPCTNLVESRHSGLSIDNIRQNVIAFRTLFLGGGVGGTELGFDDLLLAIGREELSNRTLMHIEEILVLLDGFTLPFAAELMMDPTKGTALFAALKDISDILKTEFVAVLDLQLPASAAGDND